MIENIENRDILSFEIEKSIVNEKKIIGSFQKNSATIELLNPDNKYSNLKGTYITTIRGTFYVDKIDPIQENIKIKLNCYDLAQKFDEEYDKNIFEFPMTLKQWKESICEYLGIVCDTNDFPNCDYLIEEHPYIKNKATYRNVIEMIAQAGSCWVIIDYDDVLKFQWFDNNTNNDIEDWFELKTEDEESAPVNIVVLGRGDVEDNVTYPEIEPENPKEIRIDSNEILDLHRKEMIVPIFDQVNDFKYTIFSMKTAGRLNARVGQKISYLDMYRKPHNSFIMKHILTFSGGDYSKEYNWVSSFEANEIDETNTQYKYAESIEERTDRTERLANKLDGIIYDVVEQVTRVETETENRLIEVTEITNSVQETINSTSEKIEVIEKQVINGVESLKNNLVTIDINGISVSTNLSAISTIMTNDTFAIKSGDKSLAFFGYDPETQRTKAEMDNLTVTNYFVTGYHRLEKFEPDYEQRTGIFYVGDDA